MENYEDRPKKISDIQSKKEDTNRDTKRGNTGKKKERDKKRTKSGRGGKMIQKTGTGHTDAQSCPGGPMQNR